MSLPKEQIFYGDVLVRHDNHGFISLTDMWVAAGSPDGKHDPRRWKDKAGSEFIEFISNSLNVPSGDIYKTSRGKYGGTWAHWQIALAYAKYLSPEFHAWANQAIKDRIEEEHDPELGITRSRDRAVEKWRRQGKDDNHIQMRLKSIDVRNNHTGVLKEHGVDGFGYGNCTNSIYLPILGGKANDLRKQRGLSRNANLRDNISAVELAGVMFAETLATDKIVRENRQGNNSCAAACLGAGMNVKSIIDKHENSLEKPKKRTIPATTAVGERFNSIRTRLKQ